MLLFFIPSSFSENREGFLLTDFIGLLFKAFYFYMKSLLYIFSYFFISLKLTKLSLPNTFGKCSLSIIVLI